MVKSMTGFASAMRESQTVTVGVTIRTLNHRFLDLQLRLPSALADLEANLRQIVARRIARGRAELTVSLQLRRPPAVDVEFNEQLGAALHVALEAARARGLVTGALTPGDLSGNVSARIPRPYRGRKPRRRRPSRRPFARLRRHPLS